MLINTDLAETGENDVSLFLDENRIKFFAAYTVGNATLNGVDMTCEGFEDEFTEGVKGVVLDLSDVCGVERVGVDNSTVMYGIRTNILKADYLYFHVSQLRKCKASTRHNRDAT